MILWISESTTDNSDELTNIPDPSWDPLISTSSRNTKPFCLIVRDAAPTEVNVEELI